MGTSRRKVKYSGKLAKAIDRLAIIRPQGLRVSDPEIVAKANEEMVRLQEEALEQAFGERISLLMDHYKIEDKADYLSLAFALAVDHVPGFSVKLRKLKLSHGDSGAVEMVTQAGRRRYWTDDRICELLDDVQKTKREKRVTEDRAALEYLARRKKWQPQANHRGDNQAWIETLEARLQEGKANLRQADKFLKILHDIKSDLRKQNSGNTSDV